MPEQQSQTSIATHRAVTLRVLNKSAARPPHAIFLLSTDGVILYSDSAGCELLGCTAAKLTGKLFKSFLAHQDAAKLEILLTKSGESSLEQSHSQTVGTIVSSPTTKTVCSFTFTTLRDQSGQPCNIVVWAKHEETEACRALKLQSQRLKSLEILAGGMAHTLNNTLTGLMLNVQMAQLDADHNPDLKRRLEEIQHSGRRLAEICHELSCFTREGPSTLETLSFNTLLRTLWPSLIRRAGVAVILELSPAEDLPDVRCDQAQLRKVVQNLFKNALESIDGTGAVTFTTKSFLVVEEDRRESYALLTITDTGCGMGEEVLLHACDPFFTTKFIGRGLGLSSTVGIVRAHGGFVELQSSPGKGTTVRVYLPAAT